MAKEMDRAKTRLQSSFIAQPKSKIAKLVHLLPEIESSIAGGHTYQDCVGLLREYGLEFTLTSFATTLKRARKLSESDRARILGITDDAMKRESGLTEAGGTIAVAAGRNTASLPDTEKHEPSPNNEKESESPSSGSTIVAARKTSVLVVGVEKSSGDINPIPELTKLW